jgi:antitoxin component of RelBE/YafQ-DinJ toxin-antitoxin module
MTIVVRINADIRKLFSKLAKEGGLNTVAAVRSMLRAFLQQSQIPFSSKLPKEIPSMLQELLKCEKHTSNSITLRGTEDLEDDLYNLLDYMGISATMIVRMFIHTCVIILISLHVRYFVNPT